MELHITCEINPLLWMPGMDKGNSQHVTGEKTQKSAKESTHNGNGADSQPQSHRNPPESHGSKFLQTNVSEWKLDAKKRKGD